MNFAHWFRAIFVLVFMLPLGLSQAFAQETVLQIPLSTSVVKSKDRSTANRKQKLSGQFKLEGSQYSSSLPENPRLDQGLLTSAHLISDFETASSTARADFSAESYVDWGANNYSVQELFWARNARDKKTQMSAGRKLEYWSKADDDWNLGLWQPEAVFDSLRPVDQGLTGFIFRHQVSQFEHLLFVSPLFVPTMGPEVKEEGGSLVANSRWHRKPADSFILRGKKRQIVYSLNVPNYWDLVQKPGAGYRLSFGKDRKGAWASANLGYKPMNSLLLKYDKKLASTEEGEDTGLAPLYPVVGYHALWGADAGYRFENSEVSVSYLADRPQDVNRSVEDDFIIQRAAPAQVSAIQARHSTGIIGFSEPVVFSLGYLNVESATLEDFDANGISQGAVFSQRFNFTRAAVAAAEFSTRIFKKPLSSRFSYMREFAQKGMIASGEFQLQPAQNWLVTLGADVLGVDDSSEANKDDRFLNQFRANDRVYGGMTYVF